MEKILLALPKPLILLAILYIAILMSYAVYDNRDVDFWSPKIHSKVTVAPSPTPSPTDSIPSPTPHVDVVGLVEKLSYEDTESAKIRDLREHHKGPWSFSKAKPVKLKIPGNIRKGEANVCPGEYEGATMELVSNLKDFSGKRTTIMAKNLIFQTINCSESIGYDMQINCQDAQQIFTKIFVECDPNGTAKFFYPTDLLALVGVISKS